jgi:hypothetical protein
MDTKSSRVTFVAFNFAAYLAVTVFTTDLAAESVYYRWTDANGTIQLSDRPPAGGIPFDTVTSRPYSKMSKPSGNETSKTETLPGGARRAVGETASKEIDAPKNPALCASAKNNLEALENFVRIRIQDESGEFRILSPEEKEAEKDKARKIMRDNCD